MILLLLLTASCAVHAATNADTRDVVYWNSPAGKEIRARMPADADFWQLSPVFAVQQTQSYCSVASAITVLNAFPGKKPIDPVYAPHPYYTQRDFFTPAVSKIIDAKTVQAQGMTREQMAETLRTQDVKVQSISGTSLDDDSLRTLLQKALGDDGRFVLVNYLRAWLDQIGGGHWSVLAAYDATSDRVLILDVAKYKYQPVWVSISALRRAIATTDHTSGKPRGLVIVSKK